MDVELRHLRAFVMVADCGNFTRAAEGLLITQPALSRTIRQLERIVGVQLLDRSTRHVALTPGGQEFLVDARSALASVEHAVRRVSGRASLRLGFSWLLPDPWAQRVVRLFEDQSSASVEFVSCPDPLGALRSAVVDVAIVRGRQPEPTAEIQMIQLFSEERIAVCSSASDLRHLEELSWDEIPKWPLVVNTMSGTTGLWSWPEGRGPEMTVETATFDEWVESVAANRGIGVVPEVAQRRITHPALRFVRINGAPDVPVRLAFIPRNSGALIRRFTEAALEAAASGTTPASKG